MDAIDTAFRLAGGFYLFGGWLGLRAILMDSVLDKALAALSAGKEDPKERWRRWVVGASTVAIGASGAALMTMSAWALPLFVGSVAAQAAWIAGARRLFIGAEEDDEASRRKLVNAAILYGLVAIGVVWLWGAGRLQPFDEPVGVVATALAAAGLGLWFVYHMAWKAPSPGFDLADDDEKLDEPPPARLVISPRQGFYPLIDADTGQRFSHMYWYDGELGFRIEDWDVQFQEAYPTEDAPHVPHFATPEDEAAWRAEGLAIGAALEKILGAGKVRFAEGWEKGEGRDA